ncbi:NAD(P)H-flavin reductase [Legionella nagasakiensis]|uniref:NAD(P)H-flavin reductase n=1 Tax=Legionella nagasakiensis TaxID=535290 RepID=UPI0010542566|nr:NAD(P)H-flavin reductase [Legionella nagasakiensis]
MTNQLIHARVERISPLTNSILQLILAPDVYVDYHAGQYLQIILDQEAFSYSIANAPLGSKKYELHIRHSHDNPYNQALLANIRKHGEVTIHVPLGECHISRLYPQKPILFIAGGTGFAPIKAMIEHLLATDETRFFELYWGARSQSDLYMDEKVSHWQTHVSHFQYFSLLSETRKESLASMVLERHKHDLNDWQIVIGGPFDMVYNTRDLLITKGALSENLFSDAFSFETKNS